MNEGDLARIEAELSVTLPIEYREFHLDGHGSSVDSISLSSDPDFIIERTKEYREGFVDIPQWPPDSVYLGDEDDACPYVLFCGDGRVLRTDHGYLSMRPLAEFDSFSAYADEMRFAFEELQIERDSKKPWWKFW